MIIKLTFYTGRGRVLERVHGERNARWTRRRIWDLPDLWSTLTKVGPLVRRSVGEAIGHGTIRAVDDAGATGVLDTRNGLLILLWRERAYEHGWQSWTHRVDSLGKDASGLVARLLAEDLCKSRVLSV